MGIIPRESDMVRCLADKMSDKWKPEELYDTCHEDLMVLIEKPIQAGQTEVATDPFTEEEQPAREEVVGLMALLKRRVETKGKAGRPAVHTTARGRKSGRKAA